MRLGIDFDNTLVQYDHVFYEAAVEKKLIPESLSADKSQIKQFIRREQGPDAWTRLQGAVYGKYIERAQPSHGVLENLRRCKQAGVSLVLISHKTEWPVLGPKWNLREAARAWLRSNGFYGTGTSQEVFDEVWFEETKVGKLNRIAYESCDAFIDDLPDILTDTNFPPSTVPILYAPANGRQTKDILPLESWSQLPSLLETLELI